IDLEGDEKSEEENEEAGSAFAATIITAKKLQRLEEIFNKLKEFAEGFDEFKDDVQADVSFI
ncbi:hypothetical protein BGZ54_002339, partial [Gamsiella multidivaricata]